MRMMVSGPMLSGSCLFALAGFAQAQALPAVTTQIYAQPGSRPLRMDIYQPTSGAGLRPVVFWLHDGGWLSGTRELPAFVAPLLGRGIAIASIDYRLTSEAGQYGAEGVTFPAQIHDVKAAIRFLRARAPDFNIDRSRFAVWGSSAGGHLAALAGTSANVAALEGVLNGHMEYSSRVQAVVDYYGPTDLLQLNPDVTTPPGSSLDHDPPGAPGSLLIGYSLSGQGLGNLRANLANPNRPFPTFRDLAVAANPITHVDARAPPFLIAHGTADTQVALHQSERLRDALLAVGGSPQFIAAPGAGHGTLPQSVHDQSIDFLVGTLTARTIPIGNPLALSGLWFEPATSGQGLEVQWLAGDAMVVNFYGHRDSGANLFLTGVRAGRPSYGQTLSMQMVVASNGRFTNFSAADIVRSIWGTLDLTFIDCDHASAVLAGADGQQILAITILARVATTQCD
jgi:acetyl esterase/lipase